MDVFRHTPVLLGPEAGVHSGCLFELGGPNQAFGNLVLEAAGSAEYVACP